MDIEVDGGAFAHGHSRVARHAGEVGAAVGVDWGDGQVAPGRHPFPVRQHLLPDTQRGGEEEPTGRSKTTKRKDGIEDERRDRAGLAM